MRDCDDSDWILKSFMLLSSSMEVNRSSQQFRVVRTLLAVVIGSGMLWCCSTLAVFLDSELESSPVEMTMEDVMGAVMLMLARLRKSETESIICKYCR